MDEQHSPLQYRNQINLVMPKKNTTDSTYAKHSKHSGGNKNERAMLAAPRNIENKRVPSLIHLNKLLTLGIPFFITNYRKGGFSALFSERSHAVRKAQLRSRS